MALNDDFPVWVAWVAFVQHRDRGGVLLLAAQTVLPTLGEIGSHVSPVTLVDAHMRKDV